MYSFLSTAVMTLTKKADDGVNTDVVKVLLEPKSLLILEVSYIYVIISIIHRFLI